MLGASAVGGFVSRTAVVTITFVAFGAPGLAQPDNAATRWRLLRKS